MHVPVGVLGRAKESDKPNHWFKVVDDRHGSGGWFVLQGWDGVDSFGRRFEYDDWLEEVAEVDAFFGELPWQIEWVGST